MSAHSVEKHLGFKVEDYDREIRRLVPHYDELVAEGIRQVATLASPAARILDLGCGTGRFAGAALAALPEAKVVLLDVDVSMLAIARGRLEPAGDRASFVHGSFYDPLPPADVIVASLSLHHVQDLGEKERIYRLVREALAPGGVFLVLDATVSDDPVIARATFDGWADAMGEHGIDRAAAEKHFADWLREETYVPLHVELASLARAGFARPECFWRRGPLAMYGGRRDA